MSDRVLLGTRKGLFLFRRNRRTGRWLQSGHWFAGDPVSMVLPDPRDGSVYACLDLGHFGVKIHRSDDGGRNWHACAVPTYPAQPADAGGPAWSLKLVWSLEVADPSRPGTLWAGTLPGGLFHSTDGAASWTLNRELWDRPERAHWTGGGYDTPGIHSICVHPGNPDRIDLAVSCGGVWTTADGGHSWANTARGLRAAYMPPERAYDPDVQDPHRMVQCRDHPDVYWIQHHNGIFRRKGDGQWREVRKAGPSTFGFAVVVHPRDPDTVWFVPARKDECRIPVDGRMVVTRSRDGGRSFRALNRGLPAGKAYDLVYRHGLAVSADGTRLAMASTTGSLWVSDNQADRWQQVTANLPPVNCVRFMEPG